LFGEPRAVRDEAGRAQPDVAPVVQLRKAS
jgi:hypothetical protein